MHRPRLWSFLVGLFFLGLLLVTRRSPGQEWPQVERDAVALESPWHLFSVEAVDRLPTPYAWGHDPSRVLRMPQLMSVPTQIEVPPALAMPPRVGGLDATDFPNDRVSAWSGILDPNVRFARFSEPTLDNLTQPIPGSIDSMSQSDWDPGLQSAVDHWGTDSGITAHKNGFFQRFSITSTWLAGRPGGTEIEMVDTDVSASFALPFPTRNHPLILTPGFRHRNWEPPGSWMLPNKLYDASFNVMWLPKWDEQWGAILGVAPGIYSDYNTSDDNIRVTGRALVKYRYIPSILDLYAGVVYLDRDDYNLLPAVGAIWTPTADWRWELIFPQPKIARRIGFVPEQFEEWVYLAGQFGGGTWAIQRQGITQQLTYRDLKLMVGLERKMNGGAGYRLEAGYVFARKFELDTNETFDPDDTVMIRANWTY